MIRLVKFLFGKTVNLILAAELHACAKEMEKTADDFQSKGLALEHEADAIDCKLSGDTIKRFFTVRDARLSYERSIGYYEASLTLLKKSNNLREQ